MTRLGVIALTGLLVGGAQGPAGYTVRATVCGGYAESVTSDLQSQIGSTIRRERIDRVGLIVVDAEPDSAGLSIEAWYDSLAVFRETPEGRMIPDTDGFLDGRFRGQLHVNGSYQSIDRPFVPPAVAEVVDLQVVLNDFFPRLPTRPVAAGALVSEGSYRFERLQDSASYQRWRWSHSVPWRVVAADSQVGRTEQHVRETGSMVWAPQTGPVDWHRMITIEVAIAGEGEIPRVRSEMKQEIEVRRETVCES